jgi:hypothetical protein
MADHVWMGVGGDGEEAGSGENNQQRGEEIFCIDGNLDGVVDGFVVDAVDDVVHVGEIGDKNAMAVLVHSPASAQQHDAVRDEGENLRGDNRLCRDLGIGAADGLKVRLGDVGQLLKQAMIPHTDHDFAFFFHGDPSIRVAIRKYAS